MKAPVIATRPEENHININSHQVQNINDISQEDGLAVLKATFPDLDEEQIKTFYELNGNNIQKTKLMINQQMGFFTEENDEGIDPNEVEFNLLAGQIDPNAISEDERKMIEKAIRESESQDNQMRQQAQPVQQVAGNIHAVNQAQINKMPQLINKNILDKKEDDQNEKKKNAKRLKEMKKKDANKCCIIF